MRTTEQAREYGRKWRAANREKVRGYVRKYREKDPDKVRKMISDWSKANPQKIKNYHLVRTYGITLEQRAEILSRQNNCCGICGSLDPGTKRGWQVDADHSVTPARVRGILCKNCNTALGNFSHDLETLARASAWIEGGFENIARIIKK